MVALSSDFSFEPASAGDLEELVALRIEAMRDSLTALGRFDPARARARFASDFQPLWTRHVVVSGRRVGVVVVKPHGDGLLLDHLYLRPHAQGRGLGAAVLTHILEEADVVGAVVTVSALRGSRANQFYANHGFVAIGETEWDLHYRREPRQR